jgi:AraC family transcriptional regulator of adaptative response/methylated-DNA-[protein]-cysteine methyltransferase
MMETPLGPMIAVANSEAICLLEFADRRMLETQFETLKRRLGAAIVPGRNAVLQQLESELQEYMEGRRQGFDVPVRLAGTPFQETVWRALIAVPFGATTSYGALAKSIGQPTAVRAVANANGDNRLAILIPCHRVIGSDGSLTGYGGGLWRKRRLLDHETGLFKLGPAEQGAA